MKFIFLTTATLLALTLTTTAIPQAASPAASLTIPSIAVASSSSPSSSVVIDLPAHDDNKQHSTFKRWLRGNAGTNGFRRFSLPQYWLHYRRSIPATMATTNTDGNHDNTADDDAATKHDHSTPHDATSHGKANDETTMNDAAIARWIAYHRGKSGRVVGAGSSKVLSG